MPLKITFIHPFVLCTAQPTRGRGEPGDDPRGHEQDSDIYSSLQFLHNPLNKNNYISQHPPRTSRRRLMRVTSCGLFWPFVSISGSEACADITERVMSL
ncbi:hypothetical protein PGIGA_G00143220 [Pangasianodon gigas]|uniref:Uncharacterized protein n=1 Tax=Pangasianodon gigas TaxID=30993 RepID=A0ACC5XN50_PANGG|nr:hypothetical protein [Pangasianodon gigas]